jgi:HEAT repeat protein
MHKLSVRKTILALSICQLWFPFVLAAVSRDPILQHLKNPSFQERVSRIQSEGSKGLSGLRDIAFNVKTPERLKWNAVVCLGVVYKSKALPDLERALKSDDWILRNAALVSLGSFNSRALKEWSLKLLRSDRALVVRSSTVQSLAKDLDDRSIQSLWDALNDPKNFRGNQSLWIRKQIVSAIASQPRESDADKFIGVLQDADTDLYLPAMQALEQITGLRKGSESATVDEQSKLWVKWWNSKKI